MKTSKKQCPNYAQIAYRQTDTGRWQAVRLRCKSWRCEYCAIENQKMWRKHLKRRIIDLGGEWYFGTITAPSWDRRPAATLYTIRLNFDRFMKRLRRVFRHDVHYVRIYEVHQKDTFHLHIIISGLSERVESYRAKTGSLAFRPSSTGIKAGTWSIKTWWKKTLSKCGCGYIADVKQIPAIQAIGYVTEYMTKQAQDYHVSHLRRIQTSRGIGSPQNISSDNWRVHEKLWGIDIDYQPFTDLTTREIIPETYWQTHDFYPPGQID